MYEDINKVLTAIKVYFEEKCGERFEMKRSLCDRYVTYQSESYFFDVMAAFIQARVQSDFSVSIEQRLEDAIADLTLEPKTHYRFTSKTVQNTVMPIEYCVDKVE